MIIDLGHSVPLQRLDLVRSILAATPFADDTVPCLEYERTRRATQRTAKAAGGSSKLSHIAPRSAMATQDPSRQRPSQPGADQQRNLSGDVD